MTYVKLFVKLGFHRLATEKTSMKCKSVDPLNLVDNNKVVNEVAVRTNYAEVEMCRCEEESFSRIFIRC